MPGVINELCFLVLIGLGSRDRQVFLMSSLPFITLVKEHDRDLFPDWILAITVFANQPGLFEILKLTFSFNTNWAT